MKKPQSKIQRSWLDQHAKLAVLAVFLLGTVCGLVLEKFLFSKVLAPIVEHRPGGYEFINPLLECDMAQDTVEGKDLIELKRKVRAYIDEKKGRAGVSHISLYYRDLNNGPWIGVEEKAHFSPSSLLKVPLMMAILKEAERNPRLLKQKLTYRDTTDANAMEYFKPSRFALWGKPYTVEELLRFSAAFSDNNAYLLLLRNFPQDKLVKVYTELGVDVPFDDKEEDFMTVKEYASFFRILFNASYLNKDMSMKALRFLAESDFKEGLTPGLSASVGVVHKFGERTLGANAEIRQLHDCGIVYYPDHPYLLCIMTRGASFDPLKEVISGLSKLVYTELNGQYGKIP